MYDDLAHSLVKLAPFCLLLVFWGGGLHNLFNWNTAKKYLESKGYIYNTSLILMIAILWQIGGATLAVFRSTASIGYLLLITFTFISSLFFYQFWRMGGVERYINFIFFLSNIGIIGGLLLLWHQTQILSPVLDLKLINPLY